MSDQIREWMTEREYFELPEMPHITELMDGELVMSPAATARHQRIVMAILKFFFRHVSHGTVTVAPCDVRLDVERVLQPDIFWVAPESQCREIDEKYWQGPPDLVIEVLSPSTASRDRGIKYEWYQQYGVREYWQVDPDARFVAVYVLRDGEFKHYGVFEMSDTFESPVLDNLKVDVGELLKTE